MKVCDFYTPITPYELKFKIPGSSDFRPKPRPRPRESPRTVTTLAVMAMIFHVDMPDLTSTSSSSVVVVVAETGSCIVTEASFLLGSDILIESSDLNKSKKPSRKWRELCEEMS